MDLSIEELRIILKALNEHWGHNEKFNWSYANQIDSIAEEIQKEIKGREVSQ